MAGYIKRIRTPEGDKQIDYNALANLPCYIELSEGMGDINETFTISPGSRDGDKYFSEKKPLGLVVGEEYAVSIVATAEGNIIYDETVTASAVQWFSIVRLDASTEGFSLFCDDNTTYQLENGYGQPYAEWTLDNYPVEEGGLPPFDKVEITVTGRGRPTLVLPLPEYLIPDTIARTADVEAVLDELHAYAQALIGGDA